MAQPFLSLCCIVRDASQTIGALLESVLNPKILDPVKNPISDVGGGGPAFDEFVFVCTGSADDTREKIAAAFSALWERWSGSITVSWPSDGKTKEFKGRCNGREIRVVFASFKWINDFSAARNFSFGLATGKWRFYLDADDTLPRAANLRASLRRTAINSPNTNCILMPYDYVQGQLQQDTLRGFRWADGWKFFEEIHEDCRRHPPGRKVYTKYTDLAVVHAYGDNENAARRLIRNETICAAAYNSAVKEGDVQKAARMAFFLGEYLLSTPEPTAEQIGQAENYFKITHQHMSTNFGCFSRVRLARLCLAQGRHAEALEWASLAAGLTPEYAEGLIVLGIVHAEMGMHNRAIDAFDLLNHKAKPVIGAVDDKTFSEGLRGAWAAISYAEEGRLDDAARELQRITPELRNNFVVVDVATRAHNLVMKKVGMRRLNDLVDFLIWDAEPLKALDLVNAHVPACLEDSLEVAALRRRLESELPHMTSWDGYRKVYAEDQAPVEHSPSPEQICAMQRLGRNRASLAWAQALPKDGPRVRICSIGFNAGIVERDMLLASDRIDVVVADVAADANEIFLALQAKFPGRVTSHDMKLDHLDWCKPGETFDAIFIFEVLEHLPDPQEALETLRAMLKPEGTDDRSGGMLFLSCPVAEFWLEPHQTLTPHPRWFHVTARNPPAMWRALREVGLDGRLEATEGGAIFLARMHREQADWYELRQSLRAGRVSIVVPSTPQPFDPDSLKKGHIGGSEEAVIHLAPELAKLGYEVTVYAPRAVRNDLTIVHGLDGVLWRTPEDFDAGGDHGTVIFWRCPALLLNPAIAAGPYRKLLWLHDTSYGAPPEAYKAADAVITLSQIHGEEIASGDGYKGPFARAQNGIDLKSFPELQQEEHTEKCMDLADGGNAAEAACTCDLHERERDPHKVIYASSPDRGLLPLLKNWAKIRAAVPEATLDIYYSWKMFEDNAKRFPEVATELKVLQAFLDQPGVTFFGGVDHDTLHAAFRRAGVLAYFVPTFKEISCITIMKCQASGCWPVVSNVGALPETTRFGGFICRDEEEFVFMVISTLKDPPPFTERKKMSDAARAAFSWDKAAIMFRDIIEGNIGPEKKEV